MLFLYYKSDGTHSLALCESPKSTVSAKNRSVLLKKKLIYIWDDLRMSKLTAEDNSEVFLLYSSTFKKYLYFNEWNGRNVVK